MENKNYVLPVKDTVCVDTYRVFDSCRDKDCFENARVFLTAQGQDILDHTGNVRVKSARILWSSVNIQPMPFHRGFYQLHIRLYVRVLCDACISAGNTQEVAGVSVVEKKIVLFGSEGNVQVFKTSGLNTGFCCAGGGNGCTEPTALPIAVLETVDPVVLDSRIVEARRSPCGCGCMADEIPEQICCEFGGRFVEDGCNQLLISLGIFSVVRLERPGQFLMNASEYYVPEKECVATQDENPCSAFRKMKFPIEEFCAPPLNETAGGCLVDGDGYSPKRCGCDGGK